MDEIKKAPVKEPLRNQLRRNVIRNRRSGLTK